MSNRLQHGDSLYRVIEKINEIIDGTVQPGSGGSGGSLINQIKESLFAEIERATAAEQYLQKQIDDIVMPEPSEDTDTVDIETVKTALVIESLRAATAEQSLHGNIEGEVNRAKAAEAQLQSNIDAEANRAKAAEQDLQKQIDSKITDTVPLTALRHNTFTVISERAKFDAGGSPHYFNFDLCDILKITPADLVIMKQYVATLNYVSKEDRFTIDSYTFDSITNIVKVAVSNNSSSDHTCDVKLVFTAFY